MNHLTNGKGPEVLRTPQGPQETTHTAIIAAERPDCKNYQTAQAALALKGFTLNRSYRIDDGRVTYLVANWLSTRSFTHWHDVAALIASLSSGEGGHHE